MKIEKKLKYATFFYDEDSKEFEIKMTPHGENNAGFSPGATTISLNKIYAFAFTRFVVRMAQRNWLRKGKKNNLDKLNKSMLQSEVDRETINKDQLEFFNE
jgi:hypothetical protein